jgi:hypothetical protein
VLRCPKKEAILIRRSLGILGAATFCFCAVVMGNAVYARHQASTLIAELKSLDTAANPSVVALALKEKYRSHLVEKNCESDLCQYQFLFTNAAISRFRVVPRAEIRAYLTFNHSGLVVVYVEYTSSVFKTNSPIVGVQEDFCTNGRTPPCDYFYLNPHGLNVPETWNGTVGFGQMASQVQKQAAWALNPSCFATLKGCRDISKLLPTVWKLTSSGAVSSLMRSMADSIADTAQPLPQ